MKNCSSDIPWRKKADFLSDFCVRMKISGYSERYRENIIKSSLVAWDRMVEQDEKGERQHLEEGGEEKREGEEEEWMVQEGRRKTK